MVEAQEVVVLFRVNDPVQLEAEKLCSGDHAPWPVIGPQTKEFFGASPKRC